VCHFSVAFLAFLYTQDGSSWQSNAHCWSWQKLQMDMTIVKLVMASLLFRPIPLQHLTHVGVETPMWYSYSFVCTWSTRCFPAVHYWWCTMGLACHVHKRRSGVGRLLALMWVCVGKRAALMLKRSERMGSMVHEFLAHVNSGSAA